MKILYAIFQTGSGANGGVESITQLIENLWGVEPLIVTQMSTSIQDRWKKCAEVFVKQLPYGIAQPMPWRNPFILAKRFFSVLRFNLAVARLLKLHQVKVVHANDSDALIHTGFAARLLGIPVVTNIRDIHAPERKYGAKWKLVRWLSNRIIALSEDMTVRLRARLSAVGKDGSDISFVYSIVDLDRMQPVSAERKEELRKQFGISPGEFAIGYVANVFKKKNQLRFIQEAAGEILEKLAFASIHFVGDFDPQTQPYAAKCLEAVKALPVRDRIHFHGYTSEVAPWYQALDCIVLASEREGLARCMIESLACGTPVISFDVPSAREILEQHDVGIVVEQGNFLAIANAVEKLARDMSLRRTMGTNGAQLARRLFAKQASAAAYLKIYQDLSGA